MPLPPDLAEHAQTKLRYLDAAQEALGAHIVSRLAALGVDVLGRTEADTRGD
ncbi:hypothetical protein ACFVFI_37270 [Streptomyces sp. NPDC057705]|uniref:hypothetical protein n=1 Tax=Streptomyces sp. NPDC057705 TaxID=3346222 RepID=UPI003697FE48